MGHYLPSFPQYINSASPDRVRFVGAVDIKGTHILPCYEKQQKLAKIKISIFQRYRAEF